MPMFPPSSSQAALRAKRLSVPHSHLRRYWETAAPLLRRYGLLLLYVLAAVHFVGSLLFLEYPFLNVHLWEHGYAPLPFQTRLLLAPLYRYVDTAHWSLNYAARLARNDYFFPRGVDPATVLQFLLGIVCVLIAGWVAVRLYDGASRRRLLRPLVFPVFLGLCTVAYIVHTVQNFDYVYDLPSLAAFAIGFYLIYYRKPLLWFVLLFTIATLNRETTLLLLPFWALSQIVEPGGRLGWRKLLSPRVALVLVALCFYWAAWHVLVYRAFPNNISEYYTRFGYNLKFFFRLRYWPQLASTFGFLWPFLILYRRRLADPQLRAWLLMLPVWYAFMFSWGIVTETRIFGELFPFLAPVCAILGEEVFAAKVLERVRPRAAAAAARRDLAA